jgi:uncharacterized protein (DUF1778 family)
MMSKKISPSVFAPDSAKASKMQQASEAVSQRTILGSVDYASFFEALEHPPEPTEALRRAYTRQQSLIVSKLHPAQ